MYDTRKYVEALLLIGGLLACLVMNTMVSIPLSALL